MSNSKGVAMLFSKKLSNKITEIVRDAFGRYLVCKIQLGEYTYCVANIYAPNNDNPEFFQEIFEIIQKMECIFVIIGGDFNLVLNDALDRSSGT